MDFIQKYRILPTLIYKQFKIVISIYYSLNAISIVFYFLHTLNLDQ